LLVGGRSYRYWLNEEMQKLRQKRDSHHHHYQDYQPTKTTTTTITCTSLAHCMDSIACMRDEWDVCGIQEFSWSFLTELIIVSVRLSLASDIHRFILLWSIWCISSCVKLEGCLEKDICNFVICKERNGGSKKKIRSRWSLVMHIY